MKRYEFMAGALIVALFIIVIVISRDNYVKTQEIITLEYESTQKDSTIAWQQKVIEAQSQHFKECSFINAKSIKLGHDNYLQYIETPEEHE